jgi:hypothetical protein
MNSGSTPIAAHSSCHAGTMVFRVMIAGRAPSALQTARKVVDFPVPVSPASSDPPNFVRDAMIASRLIAWWGRSSDQIVHHPVD